MLSGTGTDGTLGLKAIKGESGMAMVQQVQSAKYAGMPSSAVATGLADYVLPPRRCRSSSWPTRAGRISRRRLPGRRCPDADAEDFRAAALAHGHDFSAYKMSTIRRRIERRMNLHQIKRPNEYVRYLPGESA